MKLYAILDVLIVIIVAATFSLFNSFGPFWKLHLSFAYIAIPAPLGVLCLPRFCLSLLLYSCLLTELDATL